MVAQVTDLKPGELVHTFGDVHIYYNHIEQARLQLSREPFLFPRLEIAGGHTDLDSFAYGDFKLIDYQHHPAISAPVAV